VLQAKALGAKGAFIMASNFLKKTTDNTKGRMYLKKTQTESVPVITVSGDLAHELLGLNPAQLLESIKNIPTGSYKTNVQF
jgi:hypothetical protein